MLSVPQTNGMGDSSAGPKSFPWNAPPVTTPHIFYRYVRYGLCRKNSHSTYILRRPCNSAHASLPFVKITPFLLFLFSYRFSDEIAGDKTIIRINRNGFLAHTDDSTVSTVQGCLVKHAVFLHFAPVWCSALFDFQRVDEIVFLHKTSISFALESRK